MNKPVLLTGYDEKYESFAAYWLMKVRRNSTFPVCVCDFGFSESHRKWLEERNVTVYKAASTSKGWFLKPFAIRDCPARFGVYIDIDAEVMLDLSGITPHIVTGMISVATDKNDVHWYKVSRPLNSGVIAFDNESPAVKQWCEETEWCGEWTDPAWIKMREKKGDQGILNTKVERCHILTLPQKFNWFENINDLDVKVDPEAVIWHHLGPIGKHRFVSRSVDKNAFFHW